MPDVREKLVELPVDDAILILKEEHKQRTDGYTTHLAYGGNGDPAEEVSLYALEMAIYALEQTKWIPVTERLPENNRPVLVYLKNYTIQGGYVVHIGSYDTAGFWFLRTQPGIASFPVREWVVTHWMPLPEPPKEDEDD